MLLFTVLFGLVAANPYQTVLETQWNLFKEEHNKVYETVDEEEFRKSIYLDNLEKITKHNIGYHQGEYTYEMGINYMSDLTEEEFMRYYTTNLTVDFDNFEYQELEVELDLPTAVDWRQKNYVTPVKNQGQCGSCWAFSTTGVLEGQWAKHHGHLVSLSEQNLVDCTGQYGNHGCKGGWYTKALEYVHHNGGIDTETSYGYTGRVGACHYHPNHRGATVKGVRSAHGESALQQLVATVGPIAVAIEVKPSFQHYTRGVLIDPSCGTHTNHAVLVVGYGTMGGTNYWLVKNSWGANWGDQGYIKMAKNRNNQCCIGCFPAYPIV